VTDKPKIRALEEFGRQLEGAIPQQERRQRKRRLTAAVAALATLLAAPALAVTTDLFDFGGEVARPGQPGGPPATVTTGQPRTVNVLEVLGQPDGQAALRAAVEPYGLRVRVQERPVAPAAVGRLFGVEFPRSARFDAKRHLVLERGSNGTIIVTVGRSAAAGETTSTAGLTLLEVLPQVKDAVRRADPRGTLERLRADGFEVTVKLIVDNPDPGAVAATGVKTVRVPPQGSVVIGVTNASGQSTATPRTRGLILEVAPADSKVARPLRESAEPAGAGQCSRRPVHTYRPARSARRSTRRGGQPRLEVRLLQRELRQRLVVSSWGVLD